MSRPHLPSRTGGVAGSLGALFKGLWTRLIHDDRKAEKRLWKFLPGFQMPCSTGQCVLAYKHFKKANGMPKSLKIRVLLVFRLKRLSFQNGELFTNCRRDLDWNGISPRRAMCVRRLLCVPRIRQCIFPVNLYWFPPQGNWPQGKVKQQNLSTTELVSDWLWKCSAGEKNVEISQGAIACGEKKMVWRQRKVILPSAELSS